MTGARHKGWVIALLAFLAGCPDDGPGTSPSAPAPAPSAQASEAPTSALPSASTTPVAPPTHDPSAGRPPERPAPAPESASWPFWMDTHRVAVTIGGWTQIIDVTAKEGVPLSFGPHAESGMVFTPSGSTFAFIGVGGKKVVLFDGTGKQLRELDAGEDLYTFALSNDGTLVAASSTDEEVFVWSTADGKQLHTLAANQVFDLAFAPDGKYLSAATNYMVWVWAMNSGKLITEASTATGGTFPTTLSRDGKLAAASEESGHGLTIYQTREWRQLTVLESVQSCEEHVVGSFSRDGKTLTVHAGNVWQRVYFLPEWKRTKPLLLPKPVEVVDIADNGQRALGLDDKGQVTVWHMWTQEKVASIGPLAEPWRQVSISPDAIHVAATSKDGLRVWSVSDGKEVLSLDGAAIRHKSSP